MIPYFLDINHNDKINDKAPVGVSCNDIKEKNHRNAI